jgi:exosortase A
MITVTGNVADNDFMTCWRRHALALAAIAGLIVLEFHDTLEAALRVWIVSPTYSHCFLIVPIIIWLIWEKWDVLRSIRPVVAPRFMWFIPLLLVLWWLGELSAINEVRQYAVIGLLQVAIITLLGIDVLRIIWFPVFFLLFLVPTGEYLIAPMQQFATRFVDICLNLLRIPHYTEGTTFELTNGRFEVAEACAGLRFLIATVTLGVLFSYLMYRKIYKITAFLVASVAVPLIGNGLRIVGIILLAHFTNNEYGAGADHIVYGWGFNVAILFVLILVGALFRDDVREEAPKAAVRADRNLQPAALLRVSVATALLISAGPAMAFWRETQPTLPNMVTLASYLHGTGWQPSSEYGHWAPHFPGADGKLLMLQSIDARAPPVDIYIGYYARPRGGHTVTAHLNLPWNEKGWAQASENSLATASLGRQPLSLLETTINSNREKRLVWSVYWVNGHFTTRPLSVKLRQAEAALEGREGQAFVAVSTPVSGPIEEARARLTLALAPLGKLSQTLDRAGSSAVEGDR